MIDNKTLDEWEKQTVWSVEDLNLNHAKDRIYDQDGQIKFLIQALRKEREDLKILVDVGKALSVALEKIK